MILTILHIRFNQAMRVIKQLGFLRGLVLLGILAFVFFMLYQTASQGTLAAAYITALIILAIHAARKDKHFIRVTLSKGRIILLVEYLFVSLPATVICLVTQNWISLGIIIITCILLPLFQLTFNLNTLWVVFRILLNPFTQHQGFGLNLPVPVKDPGSFEWISGLRRYFMIILLIYLIILPFSFKTLVGPIGMVVLSMLVSGFYYSGEPREFIEHFASDSQAFILKKIKKGIKHLVVMLAPIIIVSMIFQYGIWYYTVGALLLGMIIQVVTIIFKYALFEENADLSRNAIIVSLNILCILLPFFWPLPVIMGMKYYAKAKNNLKIYWDDIH